MRPILVQFGGVTLLSYTLFLDLALLVGLGVAYCLARRYRFRYGHVLDAALWGILVGLVGARVHFVLANWAYYAANPGEIAQFWRGGMAFGGGLAAGVAACWLYSRIRRVSLRDILDPLAPALALASALGWVGNLLAGSAYGRPGRGFGYLFLPDIYGYIEYRFATQIAGALACIIVFALAWWALHRRPWPGAASAVYLVLTGATQFMLEFMRGDDSLIAGGLRLAQWLDAAAVLTGVVLLFALRRRRRPVAGEASSQEVALG